MTQKRALEYNKQKPSRLNNSIYFMAPFILDIKKNVLYFLNILAIDRYE